MSTVVDLRSDTFTRPTPAMRAAIAAAEVGDDVFGEDPTVNRLEEHASDLTGKEAALFVPSGTMANQLAIRSQTSPGDEILLEEGTHPYNFESGAPAALSGVQVRPLRGERGVFTAEQMAQHLRGYDDHYAPVTLVVVENTNNRAGGALFPLGELERIWELARASGLNLHIDGARIFNASIAAGVPVSAYGSHCHSLSFCFSKGLGAPVGSVLCGSRDLIKRARRFRKMFGGGMRQAGFLAAAALHALEHHVERLADDHARATRLAAGIAAAEGFRVVNDPPDTNILVVDADAVVLRGKRSPEQTLAAAVCTALGDRQVLALTVGPSRLRLVTHLDVDDDGIGRAIRAFEEISAS